MAVSSSVEIQVISRLLTTKDQYEIDRLTSYDTSYYAVFKDHIQFILDHKDKYGKVPDLFTFQAEFEDAVLVETNESLEFLENKLKENKSRILFLETFNTLSDLGSGDVLEAWEYLNRQCELAADLDSSKPADIVKESDIRAQKIIEFNKQERIPTGFKEIDDLMYGGLSTVEEFLVIVARTNSGKAQPLWSKILTPTGWVKMGDIQIGDEVLGENNDNGRVVKIFPQGEKDYYKITFDDGTVVECCDDHLWKVLNADRRIRENKHYEEHEILTTRELRSNIDKNYTIDITSPIEFISDFNEEDELDGYLLGVILGDGGLRDGGVVISNYSEEIWNKIEKIAGRYNCIRSGINRNRLSGKLRNRNFIKDKLTEYGLMNKKSIDKFIPKQYLKAPVNVRKSLLAGLLDTDGYISKDTKTVWEFDTSSEQLAEDFVELARSLGVKVKIYPRTDSYYTKDGVRIKANGSRHITCRSLFNPFTIRKKSSRFENRQYAYKRSMLKRHAKRIVSIEHAGKTECQCILVDNKSHTYITDGYTTTHNSWVATKMIESAQKNGFNSILYSPEMQSSFIGTRFDTWRAHFKNSDLYRGHYSDEYKEYIENLKEDEVSAIVVEDSDMSGGHTTVHALENLVKRYNAKLLIIDGLSYIHSSGKYQNETLRYRDICNDLFRVSKTYGCAVVATIQANRDTLSNKDENGESFPTIYNVSDSDYPARIATQVFAVRQLYEKHVLEFRLEKIRNARNEKPVLTYMVDFNTGSLEYSEDGDDIDNNDSAQFSTPTVTSNIVNKVEFDDDDLDVLDSEFDDDEEDIEF